MWYGNISLLHWDNKDFGPGQDNCERVSRAPPSWWENVCIRCGHLQVSMFYRIYESKGMKAEEATSLANVANGHVLAPGILSRQTMLLYNPTFQKYILETLQFNCSCEYSKNKPL